MTKSLSISGFMSTDVVTEKLKEILGRNAKSFVTSALQAVASNELLKKATPQSVYGAVVASAVMNLPINQNLGHAYIVPYKGQAQLQIGWKGFVQLAIRTKQYQTINTTEIYENQFISEDVLTGEVKVNNVKGVGPVIGYLAYFKLLSGFEKWLYMTREDANAHAKKYSKSYSSFLKKKEKDPNAYGGGVWADGESGFNSMAKKTVLKLLLNRFGVLSFELQKAVEVDQAIVDESDELSYADNEKNVEMTAEDKKEKAETKKDKIKKTQGVIKPLL